MSFISIFDVMGPNMIGPSSSHTAGAARIGFLAQKMINGPLKEVNFTLYGSFARTFKGHGTDRALLGGIMGFSTDDMRIRNSFEIAKEKGFDPAVFAGVDEKPRNKLLSRRVKGYSNATEDNLAQMQFEFLRKKAASGESFVVLGRCSETILKEYDSLVSIFVTGNKDRKLKHVIEKFSLSETAAAAKITKHDAYRRRYHNHYSDFKWGDSRNYDVCINSSRIGVEGTAKLLKEFVESIKKY